MVVIRVRANALVALAGFLPWAAVNGNHLAEICEGVRSNDGLLRRDIPACFIETNAAQDEEKVNSIAGEASPEAAEVVWEMKPDI